MTVLGNQTVDAKSFAGVEQFWNKNSTGNLTINNLGATTALGFEGSIVNNTTVNYAAGALQGANDKLTLALKDAAGTNGVNATVSAGFESLEIQSTGTSNTLNALNAPGIESVTITGAADLKISGTALDNKTSIVANAMTGKLLGNTIDATTGYTTDDIQGSTQGTTMLLGGGDDNVQFTSAALAATKSNTLNLGAGNNRLDFIGAATSPSYIFAGAGNDTVRISGATALTTADLISLGAGDDTLVLNNSGVNTMVLQGVENLTLANTATGANIVNSADGKLNVVVQAGAAGAATAASIAGLSAGSTVTVNNAAGQTVGVAALTVGFQTKEAAATVQVNAKQDGITTVNNVTAVTLNHAEVVSAAGDAVVTNEATSISVNATKAYTVGDFSSSNKLKSLAVDGKDAVTTGEVSSTALESVTVTGVKAVNIATSTTAAFAEAGKLTSVSINSTTDSVVLGTVGAAAGKLNATAATDITVSAAKAVTAGAIGNATLNGKLGTVTMTAGDALSVAAINAKEIGTVNLTSTKEGITLAATSSIKAEDADGFAVNLSAAKTINNGAAAAAVVTNTAGNVTATVAGATVGGAQVNFVAGDAGTSKNGVVNLTASNTGGLTSAVTNNNSTGTSTIVLGNAAAAAGGVAAKENSITLAGAVQALNITGGTGVDKVAFGTGFAAKTGTIALGSGVDTVDFSAPAVVASANLGATAATDNAGLVINLSNNAVSFDAGTSLASSIAGGKVAAYNTATGKAKVDASNFDVTMSGVENVVGSANADYIIASNTGNTIAGGGGNDTIVLGAGKDTVVFEASAALNGTDTITGFISNSDKLNLDAVTTNSALTSITANGHTVAAGQVILVTATGTAADSAAAAATAISTALNGTGALTDSADGAVSYFVVADANSSAVYSYTAASGAAGITATELTLLGTIDAVLASGDILFA